MTSTAPLLLEARGVGRRFPLSHDPRARAGALLAAVAGRSPTATVTVLQGISFSVRAGESLGVIGANGAGKSTLLKLVAGVLRPSEGTLRRHGSIAALLELGAGFDPERSGRDNVVLSAGLFGLHGAALRARMQWIIDFADLGPRIDAPVRQYSSGMVMRLGFAVVSALRPQLLVTDEVLAVGDESFQRKCMHWMKDYLHSGGTLLLVAHGMQAVRELCRNAIWLHQGRMMRYGPAAQVIEEYLAWHARAEQTATAQHRGAGEYRIEQLQVNGESAALVLPCGMDLDIAATLFSPDGRTPQLAVGLVRSDGVAVFGTASDIGGGQATALGGGRFGYRLVLVAPPLLPGSYRLQVHAEDPEGLRLFDTVACTVTVPGSSRESGLVRLAHRWP